MDEINYNYPFPTYEPDSKKKFARASMIVGLCALLSLFTFILPVPLGALGLIFYCLSVRQKEKKDAAAKAGFITSSIALTIGLCFTIFTIFYACWLLRPENRGILDQQFNQVYGVTFDEYVESIYGEILQGGTN